MRGPQGEVRSRTFASGGFETFVYDSAKNLSFTANPIRSPDGLKRFVALELPFPMPVGHAA